MISTFNCPVCRFSGCGPMFENLNVPGFLFPMEESLAKTVQVEKIILHSCQACGHIFQPQVDRLLLKRIYEEYYSNYPLDHNEKLMAAYRLPFKYFFDLVISQKIQSSTPKLLEIGCSDPANMVPFVEKGWECIGVDPSPLADGDERFENTNMLSGYYEDVEISEKVDVIVSRFNLEHIVDLKIHLRKIKRDLKVKGRVIVQVPNVAYYVKNRQPSFVAHEHIHYFSEHSLVQLFENMGFSTVASISYGQPSILACFENCPNEYVASEPVDHMLKDYKVNVDRKSRSLLSLVGSKDKVVFYGCGLALYWALSVLEKNMPAEVIVVDDNPAIQGKFIPSHGIQVKQPTRALLVDSDIVVLTLNPIYHSDVVERLRSQDLFLDLAKIGVDELEHEIL